LGKGGYAERAFFVSEFLFLNPSFLTGEIAGNGAFTILIFTPPKGTPGIIPIENPAGIPIDSRININDISVILPKPIKISQIKGLSLEDFMCTAYPGMTKESFLKNSIEMNPILKQAYENKNLGARIILDMIIEKAKIPTKGILSCIPGCSDYLENNKPICNSTFEYCLITAKNKIRCLPKELPLNLQSTEKLKIMSPCAFFRVNFSSEEGQSFINREERLKIIIKDLLSKNKEKRSSRMFPDIPHLTPKISFPPSSSFVSGPSSSISGKASVIGSFGVPSNQDMISKVEEMNFAETLKYYENINKPNSPKQDTFIDFEHD
jgi:hypothetical protein